MSPAPPDAPAPIDLGELRRLLERNLADLEAAYDDQRRTITSAMTAIDAAREACAYSDAAWVAKMDETRARIREAFAEVVASHSRAMTRSG
jgi:hypothetical protein